MSELDDEFAAQLRAFTDLELVEAFNGEVGIPAWTSSRAAYVAALGREVRARGFDLSEISDAGWMSWRHRVRLVGRRLVQVTDES